MSSIGSDIESDNNDRRGAPAAPIDPTGNQIDYPSSSEPNCNGRPPFQHIAIRITIDGRDVTITPLDITNPELCVQVVAQVEAASRVVVNNWNVIAGLPPEARRAFIELATVNGPIITVRIGDVEYPDAFEATLALTVNTVDLRELARYQDFAVAVAAACHPGASSEAAGRIRDRLRTLHVQPDDVRVLARRIRDQMAQRVTTGGLTPQEAADVVLTHLQEQRALRGEDFSTAPPIRYWNGEIYSWTGRFWRAIDNFEQLALRILQSRTTQPLTSSFKKSTIDNVHAKIFLDCSDVPPPFFVEADCPLVVRPQHVLVLANGTINLDEMCRSGQLPALRRHDPRLFALSAAPYDYDPHATCPLWTTTLNDILSPSSDADHRHEVLQELAGYLLMIGDHRFEKFFIFVGDGANGKSTILGTLAHMLGTQNVSHVGLECFDKDAHLLEMANKSANIATEMHRTDRVEEGILKSWVSGEPRQVDRKFRRAMTLHPTAKLIFATNHLPPFTDTSNGIWRRMIVLPFLRQFEGEHCDELRKVQLFGELPGILNWALGGAVRLLAQGHFTNCSVCERTRAEYQHDSDPFRQFVDERCELGRDFAVLSDTAYTAYQEFCKRNGRCPKANSVFGRQVARLGIARQREATGERRWYYHGLALRVISSFGAYPIISQRNQAHQSRGVSVGTDPPSQ